MRPDLVEAMAVQEAEVEMVEVEALQEILLQLQTVEDHSEVVVAVHAVLGVPSGRAEAELVAALAV